MVTRSPTSLSVKISDARERLRLFILKNELDRLLVSRLDVIKIRATSRSNDTIYDVIRSEELADEIRSSCEEQDHAVPSGIDRSYGEEVVDALIEQVKSCAELS